MRPRVVARRVICAALIASPVLVSGCGDSGDSPTTPPNAGPRGATVSVPRLPRSLDPARASTPTERALAVATQTPLLTYRRTTGDDAATLEPALAGDLPALSPDGREYRFQLRRGLVYADGQLVKASDVERAIAHASVVSPDPMLREALSSIVGAPSRDGQTLTGVRSNDASGAVTVRLRRPDGRVPFALADPATAPMPGLPKDGAIPASTGALRIARATGRSIELAANSLRPTISTVPAAKLAQISLVPRRPAANGVTNAELRSGAIDVDLASASPSDGDPAGENAWVTGPSTGVIAMYLPQSGRTASRATRQAIAAAVDLPERPFADASVAACSLIPSFAAGSVERDPCPAPPKQESRSLLAGPPVRVAVQRGTAAEADTTRLLFDAFGALGNTPAPQSTADPLRAVRDGRADVAVLVLAPRLAHPSGWLAAAATLDPLLEREVPRLTRGPLTGTGDRWAALERRAVDRAVAVPLLAIQRRVTVGPSIDRRTVRIHPVLGVDLAAVDVR